MDVYTSLVMAAIRRSISFGSLIAGSFAALVLASFSCHPAFNWDGAWQGQRNLQIKPGTPDYLANSLKRVSLKIQGGTYELNASGIPRRGVFHSSGSTATLEPLEAFDRSTPDTVPVKLNANKDGTITMDSPDSLDAEPIVLTRESQPTASNVRKR